MSIVVILITGHPASGKTTLAHALAQQLGLPLLCRDQIKETLLDTLGWSTVEWSRKLSVASWTLLYQQIELLLRAGVAHITESNFDPAYANAHWARLSQDYALRLLQVRCETQPDVLLRRYAERISNGTRHPGHRDQTDDAAFQQIIRAGPLDWIDVQSARLVVDTTKLGVGEYGAVAAKIRQIMIREVTDVTLALGERIYTLDELRTNQSSSLDPTLSENTQAALTFCHSWLNGQEKFTLHTSGSTGAPKPITVQRGQMIASAQMTGQAVGLRPGQRALVCLPTQYIAGRMMLVRGLVLGLAMTVVEPASDPLSGLSAAAKFDFTALVPLQLQTILAGSARGIALLDQMQAILIGGGPVSPDFLAALQVIRAPIYHTYGMTETVSHVALRRLNGPAASAAFVPLPGVTLALDGRGCLTIRAPMTRDEWVLTNDLVDLHADGSFHWLGRWDNVINSGGVKVQVEKVEAALEQVLPIWAGGQLAGRPFFVGPLPDDRLGQVVTLVLEGATLNADLQEDLQNALQPYLSRYELPRRFYTLPNLARTPTGKIDRLANLDKIKQQL